MSIEQLPRPRGLLRWLSLSLLAASLGACAAQLPAPDDADALRASAQWPGTTVALLERGRVQYADHCSACHRPFAPTAHTPDVWPKLVRAMAVRSKLDEASANDVIRYLVVASSRPTQQAAR